MTTDVAYSWIEDRCDMCTAWMKLSEADGGIGLCDNVLSEHNQHLIGNSHPICASSNLSPPKETA